MRIYLEQFHTLIQPLPYREEKIYPFYLLSGEDEVLLHVCQEQLYGYLTQKGFHKPRYQPDLLPLFSSQLSLFSQKEIIVYTLEKSSAEFSHNLIKYAQQLSADLSSPAKVYIFLTGKLDKNQTKSKWVQCIETYGAVITLWPPEGYKLKKWLSDYSTYLKLNLTESQKNCILETLPNNLAEIYQLLTILHFCFIDTPITNELLNQLLYHHPLYSVQQLIESILDRDVRAVIQISQHLHKQEKILLIIWWLTQLFDWWAPLVETNFNPSPLRKRAQSLAQTTKNKIQGSLIKWKKQLFQLDLYVKNNQSLEAEYLLNQILLSIIHELS